MKPHWSKVTDEHHARSDGASVRCRFAMQSGRSIWIARSPSGNLLMTKPRAYSGRRLPRTTYRSFGSAESAMLAVDKEFPP